jgi:deazaflavin-dependent oxidoreductase (nitroreductase family)
MTTDGKGRTPGTPKKAGRLPPRFFVVGAWYTHRAIRRVTGGRRGLWRYEPEGRWGTFVLHTLGRRSGKPREAILGYIEDGPNLVTMAMNGWADPEPAWWLNLQAQPDVTVDLAHGETRAVHARAAEGEERERLLGRWAAMESSDLDSYMRRRSRETAIVVLEPRGDASTAGGPSAS